MADHQDRVGPAAADHAGPLPLQHAWLPCQEAAGGLRGCWVDGGGSGGEGGQLASNDRLTDGWMGGWRRHRGRVGMGAGSQAPPVSTLKENMKTESLPQSRAQGRRRPREEKANRKPERFIFSSLIHSDLHTELSTIHHPESLINQILSIWTQLANNQSYVTK